MTRGARAAVLCCGVALAACASEPHAPSNAGSDAGAASSGEAATGASGGAGAGVQAGSSAGIGSAGGQSQAGASAASDAGAHEAGVVSDGGDLGPADAGATASQGGTITFLEMGAPGWYPSRRDPASGECDAVQTDTCCMTAHTIEHDRLAPWDEELIMTLRGPMLVRQLAVYQPFWPDSGDWRRMAAWDEREPSAAAGFSFDGDATPDASFAGVVGNTCLVDVASDELFPCGPGSEPFCPMTAPDAPKHMGFRGDKLIVLLASMPHVGQGAIEAVQDCSSDTANNWFDAPWIGLSHGELVRSGKFGDCHCYAKDPAMWFLGDGCGQLNAFEVVNDNNDFANLDVFSTNFFGYAGYVGEGPCGATCDVSALGEGVDLIDKQTLAGATRGATATPDSGPRAAFIRPSREPRYFVLLFDGASRMVQLAVISPARVPESASALLPALPERIQPSDIGSLLSMRLPAP